MVDMPIPPVMGAIQGEEYVAQLGVDQYENFTVTESTMCLNSVLRFWGYLAGGDICGRTESDTYLEWKLLRYDAILRWNARIQEDVSTQVRKQKLFYARVGDFWLQKAGKNEYTSSKPKKYSSSVDFSLKTRKKQNTGGKDK